MRTMSLSRTLSCTQALAVVNGAALGGCAMVPCRAGRAGNGAGHSMSKCGGCKADRSKAKAGCGAWSGR